jgi:hypothetical protein
MRMESEQPEQLRTADQPPDDQPDHRHGDQDQREGVLGERPQLSPQKTRLTLVAGGVPMT